MLSVPHPKPYQQYPFVKKSSVVRGLYVIWSVRVRNQVATVVFIGLPRLSAYSTDREGRGIERDGGNVIAALVLGNHSSPVFPTVQSAPLLCYCVSVRSLQRLTWRARRPCRRFISLLSDLWATSPPYGLRAFSMACRPPRWLRSLFVVADHIKDYAS